VDAEQAAAVVACAAAPDPSKSDSGDDTAMANDGAVELKLKETAYLLFAASVSVAEARQVDPTE
jgi:hypothetical protein